MSAELIAIPNETPASVAVALLRPGVDRLLLIGGQLYLDIRDSEAREDDAAALHRLDCGK